MSNTLIGIAGLARSGKDTFAGMLEQVYFDKFDTTPYTYAFADPLKRAASEMFGIPVEVFYGGDEREVVDPFWGISPREMLQKLGTEGGRHLFGEDLWVKRAEMEWENIKKVDPTATLIVTDIRFESEAEFIRDSGGTVVHIRRDEVSANVKPHESESGIRYMAGDISVGNNSSMEDLRICADNVLFLIEQNENNTIPNNIKRG